MIMAAVILITYPMFADAVTGMMQTSLLGTYEEETGSISEDVRARLFAEAGEYNRRVFEEQKKKPFTYSGDDEGSPEYRRLLSADGSDVMGCLSVGKIDLVLPVCHGTDTAKLEYECGHMYGTSLPVGGPSTHAVIAGHTGLASAELFTRLTEVVEGDIFSISLPGETHFYRTVSVRVVFPEKEDHYLQIEEGRDLVTLYTCTPYGINDRRLLVTGERCFPESGEGGRGGFGIALSGRKRRLILQLAAALAADIFGFFIFIKEFAGMLCHKGHAKDVTARAARRMD